MGLALILSSHVAASRVGGLAQALALAAFKIDAVPVPTVLFGRHPGWGRPGGDAVSPETFAGMIEGVEANDLFGLTDAVITGYFTSPDQVRIAAEAIDRVRAAPRGRALTPQVRVIVDPTLGDTGKGLYVPTAVAGAIARDLVPRADILAPNAFELGHLTGKAITDPASAQAAARSLGKPVLVSSIPCGEESGVLYADQACAWLATHPRLDSAPSGTGDLLTALFAAAIIEGRAPDQALAQAVGGAFETVSAAETWAAPELPIVAMGERLTRVSQAVRLRPFA